MVFSSSPRRIEPTCLLLCFSLLSSSNVTQSLPLSASFMASVYRKYLPGTKTTVDCTVATCVPVENDTVPCSFDACAPFPLILSPPPPPPSSTVGGSSQNLSPFLIIVFAVLGGAFLLVTYYAVIVKYFGASNRSRIVLPEPDNDHEDFLDEDQGPVIDHPIWFIQTVGLPDSIVNSIPVCKYLKGEGLVEGTDCSVCLAEFQEDETLRLLPKCSHAFHLPCIDTWLRSHTNCPVCRAPVLSNTSGPGLSSTATELNSSNSDDETQLENSSTDATSESNWNAEGGVVGETTVRVDTGTEDEVELRADGRTRDAESKKEAMTVLSTLAKTEVQVLSSDLGDDRLEEEGNIQHVKRSFSMGSFAAAVMCFSLANSPPSESEGSSSTQLVTVNESNLDLVANGRGGTPNIFKLMDGSFTRQTLKAGPIAMKRSVSCGGKLLLSRNGGTKKSILPL